MIMISPPSTMLAPKPVFYLAMTKFPKGILKTAKMAHININGLAGFKFAEVQMWLSSALFDLLIITETKLDETFPNSQFAIQGFHLLCKDRNMHGGGVIMYIRKWHYFSANETPWNQLHWHWKHSSETQTWQSLVNTNWYLQTTVTFKNSMEILKSPICWRLLVVMVKVFASWEISTVIYYNQRSLQKMDMIFWIYWIFFISSALSIPLPERLHLLKLFWIWFSPMSGKEYLIINPHVSDHSLTYAILRISLQAPRSQKNHFSQS